MLMRYMKLRGGRVVDFLTFTQTLFGTSIFMFECVRGGSYNNEGSICV